MSQINLECLEIGDVIVLSDSSRVSVNYIHQEDGGYWVNDQYYYKDGKKDLWDKKAPYIVSILHEDTEEEMLSTENLPAELNWTKRSISSRSYIVPVFDYMRERKRDFAISEVAILIYRLTGEIVKRPALTTLLSNHTRLGHLKRTAPGRYKAL